MVDEERARNRAQMFRDRAELPEVTKKSSPRRHELDWLRVIIVLGAIAFHFVYEAQVYFPQMQSNALAQLGFAFAIQWGLPLLFLIAGASAWLSLSHRTGKQFVKERVLHLLVPCIGCVLTVIPVTLYFALLISSGPHVPFLQFYVDYFNGYVRFFQGNPLDQAIALWGNLWFIFVIFLFSLLALPLIVLLKGPRGIPVISGCAMVCRMPGGTLMAGLVFVAYSWVLGAAAPTTIASSFWLISLYALSFIAGLYLYADPSIEQAIFRDGPVALVLAIIAFGIEQILVTLQTLPARSLGTMPLPPFCWEFSLVWGYRLPRPRQTLLQLFQYVTGLPQGGGIPVFPPPHAHSRLLWLLLF